MIDAWADLEEIIYKEDWPIGPGVIKLPKVVLGLNSQGIRISTGQQIREALEYAISEGAHLQIGAIADGPTLWPSEAANKSCLGIILGELEMTPGRVGYLNHNTTPPTINFINSTSLGSSAIPLNGQNVFDVSYAEKTRTKPRGVRITYETAAEINGEPFRNVYFDEAGATTGRRIVEAVVPLAGMKMQTQKQEIETRDLPPDEDDSAAKEYLKVKFPMLGLLNEASWDVENFTSRYIPPVAANLPPNISDRVARLVPGGISDLPRELVRGQAAAWMRTKQGEVLCQCDFVVADGISEEDRKVFKNFEGEGRTFTVTGTNAISKVYVGMSQYTEGEGRPTGVAAAVFAAATAPAWEGSVSMVDSEVPLSGYMGRRVSLNAGGGSAMPGMAVHSETINIEAGVTTVAFGPLPYLSAGEFVDLQRSINQRPVTWWSGNERTSNKLGAEGDSSSAGDTINGFDLPNTIVPPGGGGGGEAGPDGPFCKVYKDGGSWKLLGGTVSGGNGVATIPDITLGSIGNEPADGQHHWLAINYTTNEEDGVLLPNGDVGSVTVSSGASLPDNKVPNGGSPSGKVHFSLGSWSQRKFVPSGCGNVSVSSCTGNITANR